MNYQEEFTNTYGILKYVFRGHHSYYTKVLPNLRTDSESSALKYREYQDVLISENLVSPNTPTACASSGKWINTLICIGCAILFGEISWHIWHSIILSTILAVVSQILGYFASYELEKYLWIIVPMRKYKARIEAENQHLNKVKEKLTQPIISETESLVSHNKNANIDENYSEYLKTLESYETILNSCYNTKGSEVYKKTILIINRLQASIDDNVVGLHYNKLINIYLCEIMKVILQNEKSENIDNRKNYLERILKLLTSLDTLISKEVSEIQNLKNMDMESTCIALEGLFKQDGIEGV